MRRTPTSRFAGHLRVRSGCSSSRISILGLERRGKGKVIRPRRPVVETSTRPRECAPDPPRTPLPPVGGHLFTSSSYLRPQRALRPEYPRSALGRKSLGSWSLRRGRSARVAPGGPSLFLLRGKISFLTHIPAFQVRRGRGQGGGGAWPLNGIFVTRQERDILPPSSSYRFPRNVTPHYDAVTP